MFLAFPASEFLVFLSVIFTWAYMLLGVAGNVRNSTANTATRENTVVCFNSPEVLFTYTPSFECKITEKKQVAGISAFYVVPAVMICIKKKCQWIPYIEPYINQLSESFFLKRAPPVS